MNDLICLLKEVCPDVEFAKDTELKDYLDSMKMVSLIFKIEDKFNVAIKGKDMKEENFKNVATLYDLILRLEDE